MVLRRSIPPLPSLLRDAGYATALFGKWHLGYQPHFGPLKSGYERYFGPLSGAVDYFSHRVDSPCNAPSPSAVFLRRIKPSCFTRRRRLLAGEVTD